MPRRHDLLAHWYDRHQIDERQLRAGRRFERLFAKTGMAGHASIDLTRLKVDGRPMPRGDADEVIAAKTELRALRQALGVFDFSLVCRVLGSGKDQDLPVNAHHGGDERHPLGAPEQGRGVVDVDMAALAPVAGAIAIPVGGERGRRRGDPFKTLQQGRLVGFDLDDDLVSALTGNLKSFLTVHGVEREDTAGQPQGGDQGLRGRDLVGFVVDDLMSQNDVVIDREGTEDMGGLAIRDGIEALAQRLTVDGDEPGRPIRTGPVKTVGVTPEGPFKVV